MEDNQKIDVKSLADENKKNRNLIMANDWLQGSTVPLKDFNASFLSSPFDRHKELLKDKYTALVISGSCDVVNGYIGDSPCVELLVLEAVKKHDSKLLYGKNPRKLHIQYGNQWYEIHTKNIIFLKKDFLMANKSPNNICSIESMRCDDWINFIRRIKDFKSNSYARTALPQEFDNLTRSIFEDDYIKHKLSEYGKYIESIFIFIDPFASSSAYRTFMFAAIFDETPKSIATDIEQMIGQDFHERLDAIDGITVIDEDEFPEVEFVMTRSEINLAVLDRFSRYYYDPISMKLESE